MKWRLLLSLMCIVGIVTAASANLLINPGFATQGGGGAQDAANWDQTDSGREAWGSHDGDGFMMVLYGWSVTTSGEFYQDVAGTVGSTYSLDFWQEGDVAWDGTALDASLVWLDTSGSSLGSSSMDLMSYSTTGTWTNHVLQGLAPANTATVRVQFAATTLNGGAGAAKFDELDLTATAIPEPGTLAILGLGFAGLCVWRKTRRAS